MAVYEGGWLVDEREAWCAATGSAMTRNPGSPFTGAEEAAGDVHSEVAALG